MAVFRVAKTDNYTVMSNEHFKDKNMSLKAKGLLSLMLSLPDEWDYSISGLVALSKDGKDSVMGALNELEELGYLSRSREVDERGRFCGYNYSVYEIPVAENPYAENPNTEKPNAEKPPQLNTNKSNTKKLNTNKLNTKEYSSVPELNEAIISFIDYRKKARKPMTDKAVSLLISKLDSISKNTNEQIEIINQSILNGWSGVFPLKGHDKSPKSREYCRNNPDDEIPLPY